MLYYTMSGRIITSFLMSSCLVSYGQVTIDVPVRFTGPVDQRGVDDLAAPRFATSLMTVEAGIAEQVRWAEAELQGDTLYLTIAPAELSTTEGVLVRFVANMDLIGEHWLTVNGSEPKPLVRTDGTPPIAGQIMEGTLCEVMEANDKVFLLGPSLHGCPRGFIAFNDRSCIAADATPLMNLYSAVDHCARQGAALCSWSEYIAACYLVGDQLNGMFTNWEWIDDTSNHTHTGEQVGRTDCTSDRTSNPLNISGTARCCFRLP